MKKNNRKGFTIVELVIVIAVIAILAAVLIPTFSNMISKANDSATLQEARNRYTNYTAEHDYTTGSPAQDLVIEVGDEYVVVKGAQMQDEIYDDLTTAKGKANADVSKVKVLCDEHNWTNANGVCADCNDNCPKTHTTGICDTCGKVTTSDTY